MIDAILPPGRALKAALVVVVPVAIACTVGGWLVGPLAVVGIALGATGSIQAAVADIDLRAKAAVVGVLALLAAAGVRAAETPVVVAVLVAVAGLAQWPVNARAAGVAVFWPALPPLVASTGLTDPWSVAIWLAVGGALMLGMVVVLRAVRPTAGVPAGVAARHAVATGAAAGLATYLMLTLEVAHGYWLVLTLVLALRPQRGETGREAVDRVVGTLLGIVIGVAVVVLLPLEVALALVVAFLVITVGWALAGDRRRQNVFVTPVILILGSAGIAGSTVELAAERIVFVGVGAAMAVAMAAALHRLDAAGEGASVSSAGDA